MVIALSIILPIVAYLFAIGVAWKPMQMNIIKRCPRCELRDGEWKHYGYHGLKITGYGRDWNDSFHMHNAAGWLALAWPAMLPVMVGQMVSNRSTKSERALQSAEADKIRRNSELEEQQHQVELARLRARENEYLDQHLKLEDIRREIESR